MLLSVQQIVNTVFIRYLWNNAKHTANVYPQANKALRSQNVDLVQENMRLKAEVVSRSPQK